jgi:hypothetical protein
MAAKATAVLLAKKYDDSMDPTGYTIMFENAHVLYYLDGG